MYLKTFLICVLCFAIFLSVGFVYITSKTKTEVQNNTSSVPYASLPQNAGVLFEVDNNYALFYLDFEKESISVICINEILQDETEIYGYPIDYTVKADYNLISYIVDSVGGIDLSVSQELLTLTGVQVVELLTTADNEQELNRNILEKIIKKISQYGFLRQDLLYIIENSETNLTVPDCYYWSDNLQRLCKNLRVIN